MEACLKEELPAPIELEEALRNGVYLAKLGHCFTPRVVPLKKIYDLDQERYKVGDSWHNVHVTLASVGYASLQKMIFFFRIFIMFSVQISKHS